MDFNYNILKLENALRELVRKNIEKGINISKLFDDILKQNPLEIKDKEYKDILEKYSRETLGLVLEKNLVLARELERLEDFKISEKSAIKEVEKLEKIIKSNFKKSKNYVGDIASLLENLTVGKEHPLMTDKLKKELEPYSMRSITLVLRKEVIEATKNKLDKDSQNSITQFSSEVLSAELEKDIILSMENKALATRKSYWDVLKTKEKINSTILSHYYDMYIDDVKNNHKNIYKTRTIDEINKTYNSKIENSLNMIDNIVGKVSSITLDHMENVNSNGRTISIDVEGEKIRKGGLFLNRDSKIGYGKFVNTAEFLAAVEQNTNKNGKIVVKNGALTKEDMQKIVSSIKQVIKIEKNEKITNQDARLIKSVDNVIETYDEKINGVDVTTTIENVVEKNLGSMFLGNKGIEITDGNYVSEEELNLAIAKFIENKKTIDRQMKVIKIKQKVAKTVAAAASVVAILGGSLMKNNSKNLVKQPAIKYETMVDNSIPVEYQRNLESNASNLSVEQQEVENLFNNQKISVDNVINTEQPIVVENLINYETPEVENNLIDTLENGQAEEVSDVVDTTNEMQPIEEENNLIDTLENGQAEEVSDVVDTTNEMQPIEEENNLMDTLENGQAEEVSDVVDTTNEMQPIEKENLEVENVAEETLVEETAASQIEDSTVQNEASNILQDAMETLTDAIEEKPVVSEVEPIVSIAPEVQPEIQQAPAVPSMYVTNEQVMGMYGLTADQLDTVKATICHESGANLDEIANVASCVKNRMNSGLWGGSDPYSVITADGQFESYFAGRYQKLKNGNYGGPEVDAVINGILSGATNVTHGYESFRAKSSPYGEQLVDGGNKYR